jgi:hypothetical protein
MKGKKVYVVLEEYYNDGDTESSVLGVFDTMEKAYNKLEEQIEVYKSYGVFDTEDFDSAEKDENSYYISCSCDDYYGSIDIIEQIVQ